MNRPIPAHDWNNRTLWYREIYNYYFDAGVWYYNFQHIQIQLPETPVQIYIIRIVHAFHLLKIKRESPDFAFGEMVGSNWWVALILGLLLGVLGVIVILNPLLGLGVIGVVVGCGMITAGINLIFLSTNVWLW